MHRSTETGMRLARSARSAFINVALLRESQNASQILRLIINRCIKSLYLFHKVTPEPDADILGLAFWLTPKTKKNIIIIIIMTKIPGVRSF